MSIVKRVTLVSTAGTIILDSSQVIDGWALAEPEGGNMDGWWTPPSPRATAKERPQTDGAFSPANLLVGARVLTIIAHHAADDEETELRSRSLMSAICRTRLRVVVEEAGRIGHVHGFVSAKVKHTHWEQPGSTWSLIITCPDPLIYGGAGDDGDLSGWESSEGVWSLAADGGLLFPVFDQMPVAEATTGSSPTAIFTGGGTTSLLVDNAGTAASWPVLEVAGPVSWARWTFAGHSVQWSSLVPSGETLRINTADGAVTQGERRIAQTGLTMDDFFSIPPGRGFVEIASSAPALMRVRWRTAWI